MDLAHRCHTGRAVIDRPCNREPRLQGRSMTALLQKAA
jgi:hypothetical protein